MRIIAVPLLLLLALAGFAAAAPSRPGRRPLHLLRAKPYNAAHQGKYAACVVSKCAAAVVCRRQRQIVLISTAELLLLQAVH
jgi:hypothetical protein